MKSGLERMFKGKSVDAMYELGFKAGYAGELLSNYKPRLSGESKEKRLAFTNGFVVGQVKAQKEYANA